MRVLELPDKLRARGLTVRFVDGWHVRGNEFPSRPDGALRHWDAIGSKHPTAGLGVITNGRPDLPGPLAQVYQSRHVDHNGLDVVYVVASGKANHAGPGDWNGISGNYSLLGVEIAWSGPSEVFGPKRVETSELVMRALLDCCTGENPNDVAEHREYAKPAGRKIDTNLDGNVMRRRMAELNSPPITPNPHPIGPDRLKSGEVLNKGKTLTSPNKRFTLFHQGDDNLVIYDGNRATWHTSTSGKNSAVLAMQTDGNLVLYSADKKVLWATWTHNNPGAFVALQDDGNLVLYSNGIALWDSKGYTNKQ